MSHHVSRRRCLRAIGVLSLAGPLAGCAGEEAKSPTTTDTPPRTDSPTDPTTASPSPTPTATGTPTPERTSATPPSVEEWLVDAPNYDGTVVDQTGGDSVTVDVGANDGYSFAPPAIRVTAGTTVTWEWTGKGGGHNVVADDRSFRSQTVAPEGNTFEHTFENAGRWPYYCGPHWRQGMKGYVVVEA